MAYEKLNVLHWHAVDDQSFPLELPSYPALAAATAFAPHLTYSAANVSDVVAYAHARGIRVLIESDTPGHCSVLQHALPQLGLITQCPRTAHTRAH
jgi:hexosaminidase